MPVNVVLSRPILASLLPAHQAVLHFSHHVNRTHPVRIANTARIYRLLSSVIRFSMTSLKSSTCSVEYPAARKASRICPGESCARKPPIHLASVREMRWPIHRRSIPADVLLRCKHIDERWARRNREVHVFGPHAVVRKVWSERGVVRARSRV